MRLVAKTSKIIKHSLERVGFTREIDQLVERFKRDKKSRSSQSQKKMIKSRTIGREESNIAEVYNMKPESDPRVKKYP